MQQLSVRSPRIQREFRRVGRIRGIDALDAHWRKIRRGPHAKWAQAWIEFSKMKLLARLGRYEEALAIGEHSLSLPQNRVLRRNTFLECMSLADELGRNGKACNYAEQGLDLCIRGAGDVNFAVSFLQAIVRLGDATWIANAAKRHGALVDDGELRSALARRAELQELVEALGLRLWHS